jgi:hypothetical protein
VELFPCALVGDNFDVVREIAQMLYRHGDYLVRIIAIVDEFDGFLFWLWVLDELPSSLDEEFNSILQVDAVISKMLVALVESTVFSFGPFSSPAKEPLVA